MTDGAAPPLLGDGKGNYRAMVDRSSATYSPGLKSTLSTALEKELCVSYVPMGRLNWNPGWVETPAEELKTLVQNAMKNIPQGWAIDGNYIQKIGFIVQDNATDIMWPDPPLILYIPRLFVRTMQRWFQWEEPRSPGCGEDTSKGIFFSSKSVLWRCLTNHSVVRRRCGGMMSRIGIGIGSDIAARRMRRIGGWGGELKAWLQSIEMLRRDKAL
ncbi:hypothetical protein AN958_01426 [Leucoagaricus sp. SymC.cos]|nr:hypothetical protein AN958_01426 [Leucoagaricus sp. SymC.cos]